MDNFENIYNTVWAIAAVCFSGVLLFARKWFIKTSTKAFVVLSERTNIKFFKYGAKEMEQSYMNILLIFLGLVFLFSGISILFRQ